jgi:hypothetical protein
MKSCVVVLALILAAAGNAYAAGRPSPEGASVYIVTPANGEVVSSPVKIVFGLSGMGVAPAGMDKTNTGHHHLLVDTPLPDLATPIPSTDNYRHFGGGQTEVVIELAPGTHTLQLLFADYTHTAHVPPVVSEQITITVE